MKPSGIITLVTDFGIVDPYLAMMKGVILSINPDAVIVDVSHSIMTGGIAQASGILRETYPFFPKGTVHVAVVDPGVGSDRRLLGVEADGHFFVGPDNGIFWPIIKDYRDASVIQLTENRYFLPHITSTFHGREVFAPVAAHLTIGTDLPLMGIRINNPVEIAIPSPYITDNTLCGEITRIDNFGNLISNITKKELEDFLKYSKPLISIGNMEIKRLHDTYLDVEEGEPLALINSSGLLEIAVNLGRASEYAGINRDEIIGSTVKVSRGG
ncbi:MAG: SAM-dependent chlorinase/fluorinase [Deltaproteobacteria bacterium]|nr:SAM-dependent chlorinase/fluorinase [Deltaproteobacteria bacterium]